MTDSKTTDPAALRQVDALVRTGSPDPDAHTPDGDCPQCPHQQISVTNPTAAVDIGGPSPNPERREGVSSPSPASGPKTEAVKSISSKNAVTHGLRAKKIENAVAPALRQQYEKLRRQYLDDYRPAGAIENTLFDMLVFAAWQLYKIRDMEIFIDLDLGMPGSFGRSEKLARYRGSHERLFFRSLNQLKQIQQERALRETDQKAALPAHLAPGVRSKTLQDRLKRLHRHPRTQTASGSTAPKKSSSMNIRPKTRRSGPVRLRP